MLQPRYFRRVAVLLIYVALSALFAFAYEIRYARHADCFNDPNNINGRCFVPGEGVLTTGGAMWGGVAIIFGCLAVLSAIRLTATYMRHRS